MKELWVSHYLNELNPLLKGLSSAFIKTFVLWITPVFCYLKYINHISPIHYLKLNSRIQNTKWIVCAVLIVFIYFYLKMSTLGTSFHFNVGINTWINGILLVGITEEIVFRGFILQKLAEKRSFLLSNVIASLLFVAIHFPKWISQGIVPASFIGSSILIFVIGFSFGYIFRKTGSLWSVIIIHSLYNLFSYISL